MLLFLLVLQVVEGDPSAVLYPGQVNIGLLADIHGPGPVGECGSLRPHAVQRAMAAVWAAHQANYDNPKEPNIGVYIYDTCGREEVAQRQAYRLLAHVTDDCPSSSSKPPLIAVVAEGDMESVRVPLKLLSAFSVPVITASGTPDIAEGIFSTAPSAPALARGGVSVLHHLRLLEVAVVAEEEDSLFAHFSAQVAHVTGMQATHVQEEGGNSTDDDADDTLAATLQLVSLYGKSHLQAVVFLVSCEEAVSLLRMVDERPQIPWLIITPHDISDQLTAEQGTKLGKVLLLSPESTSSSSSFSEYFQQLLTEDTIKYHPLLIEYAASNVTANDSDVGAVSRAVWSVSSALSEVRRRWCRGGRASPECGAGRELGRTLLEQGFDQEGALPSLRYALKGFVNEGHVRELGFYSDDEGLNVEPGVLQPLKEPTPTDSRWKIFEDTSSSTQADILVKEDLVLHDDVGLQSVSSSRREEARRTVSLTSHHETEKHVASVRPLSTWLGRPWSLAVLGVCALVSLAVLYALVFVLVKACEGQSGGGCWLPVVQLLALVLVCGAAALHTWRPGPLACGLRRAVHNTGLAFCYAGLLLKGMCLRSQSSLGLGGSLDRGNHLLALMFAVGVQVGLEWQWWLLHTPAEGECRRPALASHSYAAILLATATAVALSTKRLPYCQRESRSLIGTTLACSILFVCWCVACWLLPSALVAGPTFLLSTVLAVLLGVLLPHLIALHRHGSQHKPLVPSYADSLSTVFTMFNNNTLTGGRGKKKTLDYQEP